MRHIGHRGGHMTEHTTAAAATAQRSIQAIFDDLRALAHERGALHCLSYMIYRDWMVSVDTHNARVADQPEHRWSTERLNRNELTLLLGLIVQSSSPAIYTELPSDLSFVERSDQLLREFHDNLSISAYSFGPGGPQDPIERLSDIAREAIYYGAESFYVHQYEYFARQRYRADGEWLLRNAGISIRPMLDIARYLLEVTTAQSTALIAALPAAKDADPGLLTASLCVPKEICRKKFKGKFDTFLKIFAIKPFNENKTFTSPFEINQVNIRPIIDVGEFIYLPNIYRIFEAIYESPFYWMMKDENYRERAAKNRGDFLEDVTARIFRGVFGAENVFQNVVIQRNRKEIAGEADVLVRYGEFAIIVQAKSKRVTQRARAGDEPSLKADFESAIQAPYRQAYAFAELIEAGAEAVTKEGNLIKFQPPVRAFPVVVLSDGFPSSTILSKHLIQRNSSIAPIIWDLGILDCASRILRSPIEMLFYLKSRSDCFENIVSDSEYNFLGFHLQHKLVLPSDATMMMIDRDFSSIVDDFMIANDLKLKPERPVGILERLEIDVVSDLLRGLRTAPPEIASVVVELYEMSSAALSTIGRNITILRDEVRSGKEMKAFSILTGSGGMTYLVCRSVEQHVFRAAAAIGHKHKYDNRRDRWYVIVDAVCTDRAVDALLPLVATWREDEVLAQNSAQVAARFGSRVVELDHQE